jgi:membrane protease YdiL (CAAX protease family)
VQNNSTFVLSPPSPTNWRPDAFRLWPTLLVAVGALLAVFVPSIVYLGIALTLGAIRVAPGHPERIPPVHLIAAQIVAYVPLAIYLLIALPKIAHRSLHDLGIRVPTLAELGYGALGTIAMFVVVSTASLAIEAVTHFHDTEAAVALLKALNGAPEKIAFVVMAVVLAPLVEELAFRVFAFNAFESRTSVGIAAVLSGLVFGLVHAFGSPPSQLLTVAIPLALGGIVLALVYARTRCYWSNVVTHALFNSISVVAYFGFHAKI